MQTVTTSKLRTIRVDIMISEKLKRIHKIFCYKDLFFMLFSSVFFCKGRKLLHRSFQTMTSPTVQSIFPYFGRMNMLIHTTQLATFRVVVMMFNATFYDTSVIWWWSVLSVEETGVPGEKQQPAGSH